MTRELYEQWLKLAEEIKDRLTGDVCAEIGLYDFETDLLEELRKVTT